MPQGSVPSPILFNIYIYQPLHDGTRNFVYADDICVTAKYPSFTEVEHTIEKHWINIHRVINNWNELPDSVVLSDNLNIFKRNLDLFWKDKDFKYEEK